MYELIYHDIEYDISTFVEFFHIGRKNDCQVDQSMNNSIGFGPYQICVMEIIAEIVIG